MKFGGKIPFLQENYCGFNAKEGKKKALKMQIFHAHPLLLNFKIFLSYVKREREYSHQHLSNINGQFNMEINAQILISQVCLFSTDRRF